MKYKNEMYSLYKQPGIVKMIKIDWTVWDI
jgi:hypothetical protein